MCMAIYAALMALLWIYSDYMLEQYALSASSGANEWTVVALGWEMLPIIWPVLLLMVVASSAVTFFVVRWSGRER
jgi:hypothetical protein